MRFRFGMMRFGVSRRLRPERARRGDPRDGRRRGRRERAGRARRRRVHVRALVDEQFEQVGSGVAHGDANDQNVLVRVIHPSVADDFFAPGRKPVAPKAVPCGILDFGDIVTTWRVNEVAVAAAYFAPLTPRGRAQLAAVAAVDDAQLVLVHFVQGIAAKVHDRGLGFKRMGFAQLGVCMALDGWTKMRADGCASDERTLVPLVKAYSLMRAPAPSWLLAVAARVPAKDAL